VEACEEVSSTHSSISQYYISQENALGNWIAVLDMSQPDSQNEKDEEIDKKWECNLHKKHILVPKGFNNHHSFNIVGRKSDAI
jgi:hypothetical protein